jgi:hypothetical protein
MKDKYEQVIKLVYEITKEHSEKEPVGGMEMLEVLDNVLEYIKEKTLKQIYNSANNTTITERISDYPAEDYALETFHAYADAYQKKLDAEL